MCMKKNMTYRRLWAATLLVVLSLITSTAFAQPAARRAQQAQKAQAKSNANNMTERAKIAFPTQQKMPEDVVWRRDLYTLQIAMVYMTWLEMSQNGHLPYIQKQV